MCSQGTTFDFNVEESSPPLSLAVEMSVLCCGHALLMQQPILRLSLAEEMHVLVVEMLRSCSNKS